jgi:TonB family protein
MNLKKALILSLATHLLLCGGSVAFGLLARGGGALSGNITLVSLVGVDKNGLMPVKRSPQTSAPVPHEVSLDPVSSTLSVMNADDHDRPDEERPGVSQDGADTASGESASNVTAPAGGIGLVSPEEWQFIQAAIERAKSYPRLARERGIQGVVHVRFRVREGGTVDDVQVVRSSGSAILDSASVKTVYRASPMPHVKGWVEVPMAYVLK